MNQFKSFPCTGCGCCCSHVREAVENMGASNLASPFFFPYSWDSSGRCEKLTPDNRCSVYDTRPTLCNIDRVIALLDVSKDAFYTININACNDMMKKDGVPDSFRVINLNLHYRL